MCFVPNLAVQQVGKVTRVNMECLVEKETTDFESWRIWSRETDCVEEREWHFKPEVVVMCTVN